MQEVIQENYNGPSGLLHYESMKAEMDKNFRSGRSHSAHIWPHFAFSTQLLYSATESVIARALFVY